MKKIVKLTKISFMIIILSFIFSNTANAANITETYNSLPESQLGLNNVLNIILISIGIVIVLLAIAILIKIKEQQGPSKKSNKLNFSKSESIYDNSNMYNNMFNNDNSNNYDAIKDSNDDSIKNIDDDEDTKFNFYK